MVTDPELIIFDEPTSALDPLMTREVGMLIKQLHDNGVTILCVTHDIRLARLLSDNVTFLNHGKIRAEGALPILPYEKRIQISTVFLARHNDDRWLVSLL